MRIICATAFDSLIVVDDGRRHLFVNEPALALLGAGAGDILERRIEDFTPPELLPVLERLWARFEREGRLEGRYEVLRGDGTRRRIRYRATRDVAPGRHLIAVRALCCPDADGAGTPEANDRECPPLTRRELEVLQLAADGGSTSQIAEALFVSHGTVKTHLQNLYRKVGARDRASAVAEGLRRGLIE